MTTNEPTRHLGHAAVMLGMLLGLCNAFVIGAGIGGANGKGLLEIGAIALLVTGFGGMPAVVLGALLGWLADAIRAHPVWLRRLLLIAPAALFVMVLGAELEAQIVRRGPPQHFALVSCIPTAIAAFILERATRRHPTPRVPAAYVRRGAS